MNVGNSVETPRGVGTVVQVIGNSRQVAVVEITVGEVTQTVYIEVVEVPSGD